MTSSSSDQNFSSLRQLLLNQEMLDNHDPLKFVLDKHVEHEHGELWWRRTSCWFWGIWVIYVFSRDGYHRIAQGLNWCLICLSCMPPVGNRAQTARVNKRYVPLTYQLKTGEQVEIITKQSREPNRDWLVASLGWD